MNKLVTLPIVFKGDYMKSFSGPRILLVLAVGWFAPGALPAAEDVTAEVRVSSENFVKLFDKGAAKDVAAMFVDGGELIDENGTIYQGRTEISDVLTKFFAKFPAASLAMEIESVRSIGPNLAIEEGTRYVMTKAGRAQLRYSSVKTKVGGQWLIASLREFNDEPAPTAHEHLQQLAWLVGDWMNEGSDAAVRISYRWSEDKNYLLGEYSVNIQGKSAMKSSQRIGWDPVAGKIRSWLFDSDGGFSEGLWTPLEGRWVVKSNTVVADGRLGSATLTFTPTGNERFQLTGTDRLVGDGQAPNFDVKVVKKVTAAAAGSATPAPAVGKGK